VSMSRGAANLIRRELAALYLCALALAGPVCMLGWGRAWGRLTAVESGQGRPPAARTAFLAPFGGRWPVALQAADRDCLMGLLLDALAAAGGGDAPPDVGAATALCRRALNAPIVVTAYPSSGRYVRVLTRENTLAESIVVAARQVAAALGRRHDVERVRVDVVAEALPMPPRKRVAFVNRRFDEPFGVALRPNRSPTKGPTGRQSDVFVRLAADAPGTDPLPIGLHGTMLARLCAAAGLAQSEWVREPNSVWRLRTVGFVNDADGSRSTVSSPRGLAEAGELTPSALMRACWRAAEYLERNQRADGSYPTIRARVTYGCESLVEQAAASAALGFLCETPLQKGRFLSACHKGVAFLMIGGTHLAHDSRMKFAGRQETCRDVLELEATAQVLTALARFRGASGFEQPLGEMEGLANFLVYMQREDGLFDLRYDRSSETRSTPSELAGRLVPQARAALALCLAARDLGSRHAEYIAAARNVLEALLACEEGRKTPYTAAEARWLAAAVCELDEVVGGVPERYVEWVCRIADQRLRDQLVPSVTPDAQLAGGTASDYPPDAGSTANDLVVFACAARLAPADRPRYLTAARRSAAYLMWLQCTPLNSYYMRGSGEWLGGLRERPDNGTVRLATLETALEGLVRLTAATLEGDPPAAAVSIPNGR